MTREPGHVSCGTAAQKYLCMGIRCLLFFLWAEGQAGAQSPPKTYSDQQNMAICVTPAPSPIAGVPRDTECAEDLSGHPGSCR